MGIELTRQPALRLRGEGATVAHVFHWDGKPICSLYGAWRVAPSLLIVLAASRTILVERLFGTSFELVCRKQSR